ncbi:type I secretion system permease/ATPase [Roseibium aggregatum]|uniref:Type I secretion system ATP-binding protein PrsD n=1 Tax=Roseibium aggregatum TaxID=187304 RepID=A0A0M6XZ03_9HYPH|nr:type I secretion system permease/ATPase [Roseibium aggregatum]CTQ42248.1 Type I secretion system ATP-binding protein PrsD [Roseibium aggregatum]
MTSDHPFRLVIGRYRSALLLAVFFSFFTNLLLFVGPLYMLQIYDRVLQSRNEMTLLMLTVIAGSLLGLYGVLEFIRSRVLVRAGMRFDTELAPSLFRRVVDRAPYIPQAQSRPLLSDIDRLRDFLTGPSLLTFCDAPWVPVFLAICFLFHPLLGFVATSGAVVLFFLAFMNELMTRKPLRIASRAAQDTGNYADGALVNVEVVQALGMESAIRNRWLDRRQYLLDRLTAASDRSGIILSLSRFLRMALQVAILGTGAWLVLRDAITPGVMITASIMMGRALAPVEQSVAHWKSFAAARLAHRRMQDLFADVPEQRERMPLPRPPGRISVESLVGRVPDSETTVLAGINFALEPGEVCAIIGPSGAGKTSLVRHLIGVWRPRAGHVRFDGADFHHWDRERLGSLLGYMPQDVELFEGTVAENIARFGHQDAEKVVEAAKQAGVHDLIQSFTDGYDTQIGEGGRHLSAGQRQRVALARALYASPVFVVLDEPNSNLDSEGDAALIAAIRQAKERGQTVVFVTHKPNLLALADKALVLNAGRQQGFGPASELMAPTVARSVERSVGTTTEGVPVSGNRRAAAPTSQAS